MNRGGRGNEEKKKKKKKTKKNCDMESKNHVWNGKKSHAAIAARGCCSPAQRRVRAKTRNTKPTLPPPHTPPKTSPPIQHDGPKRFGQRIGHWPKGTGERRVLCSRKGKSSPRGRSLARDRGEKTLKKKLRTGKNKVRSRQKTRNGGGGGGTGGD